MVTSIATTGKKVRHHARKKDKKIKGKCEWRHTCVFRSFNKQSPVHNSMYTWRRHFQPSRVTSSLKAPLSLFLFAPRNTSLEFNIPESGGSDVTFRRSSAFVLFSFPYARWRRHKCISYVCQTPFSNFPFIPKFLLIILWCIRNLYP
jgi:hypothetical protein